MVNGIRPTSGSMFGSLGLEVRDSMNCQLIWKTVNKGKRSKKSVIRNSNGLSSNHSIESPVRVGDFSGSDSKKYVESSTWPNLSNESVRVPLKKRQHILSSSLYDDLNPLSIDESDDFSGIALLAATACNIITEESDNVKGGVMESGVSISCSDMVQSRSHEASYANNLCTLIEAGLEVSEHKNDFQTKDEERFQNAFELPENGITVGDGLLKETSNTVVETSGTTSKSQCIVVTLDEEGLVSDALQESNKLDGSENNSTQNIYELEMDCESPYEDGELKRGFVLYSCVENELKDGEHGYDYETDGRVDDDLNSGLETCLSINKELEGNTENIDTETKKNEPNLVDELYPPPMDMKKLDDGIGKRKSPFEKMQSFTKRNSYGRFSKVNISRTDRENSPNGHMTRITRYGSSSYKYRKTEGNNNKYWDSRHGNYFRSREMDHHHRLPRIRNGMAEEYKYQPFNKKKGLNFHGANTKTMKFQNNRRRGGENSGNYRFREEYDKKPLVLDDPEHAEWRTPRSRWGSSPKFRPDEPYSEKTRGPFIRNPKFNDRYSEDFVSSHGRRFLHPHKTYEDMFRQDQRLLLDSEERSRRFPSDSNTRSNGNNDKQDERRHRKRYADDVSPNSRCSRFLNRSADDVSPNSRCSRFLNRGGDTYGEKSFISPPRTRTRWATNNDSSFVNNNNNSLSSHSRSSPIGSFGPISNFSSQSKWDRKFSY